jgi:5'-phosphate synthase pdxT subunit
MVVGVLALQGGFFKHIQCLEKESQECREVRTTQDLKGLNALILPGGESSTHLKLIDASFKKALVDFCQTKPVFGTCCGLILLSKEVIDHSIQPLGVIDIKVARNAYGSQVESFETDITFDRQKIRACFIRAPQIMECGPEVTVLATYQDQPVLVRQNNCLVATFHPEIFLDTLLHNYFLKIVAKDLVCIQK